MQISIVNYSECKKQSHSFRIDAEFFRADYLDIKNKLQKKHFKKLSDSRVEIKHPKEIKRNYCKDGVLFFRAQNVRPLEILTESNPVYISEIDADVLKNNKIRNKDILLTRTGANFGQCAIFLENLKAIASSHTFIIKSGELNPFFLTIFLNTKFGKKLIDKGMYGGSQPEIAPFFIYQIPLPIFNEIDSVIEKNYLLSQKYLYSSRKLYNQAQTLLLSELGLTHWQPKHQLTFIKNYSDTKQAGRIDAEYYQPKYEEIINAIKNYSGGWDTLDSLVRIKKCIEVGSDEYLDEGIPFVRVSNISPFELSEEKYISSSLYSKLTPQEENIHFEKSKNNQPKRGEILFSKDGTPGIAYYLKDKPQKMISSGGILRLQNKTDKVNNEYLTLVLNSILTQEQVNRDVGGSIILHWRPDQVKETVIPILSESKQLEIQQKVTESFNLRKKSKHLLECAKKAVEMAIEQDEQTAIKWLENEVNEIQI